MPFPDILTLLAVLIVGFLIAGILSPFEALGWWAGWYGRHPEEEEHVRALYPVDNAEGFVVFLSGIHSVSGETYAEREILFLERLRKRLTDKVVVIDDIFPYSVTNRALTGQRIFAKFWRWALKRKLSGPGLAGALINFRNVWQVAVSADSRYGPIYNQGSAEMIAKGLELHGYEPGSGVPVTLIGYSGGGQIAVGAAPHLRSMLSAPISVVSLGGVISSDPGLLALEHVYHLYGRRDMVQRTGNFLFPGRWPILPYSAWNQAKQQGVIKLISMGPADHTGPKGYLDAESFLPNGQSYLDATVETIARIVESEEVVVEGLGSVMSFS